MSDTKKDIDSIEDEETLEKMLRATEDFEERKKIRGKLKELHEKKAAEYEKRRKEAEKEREDSAKMRQRHAEEAKQKKLAALSGPSANVAGQGPSATEQYQRQKLADAEADKQKRLESMTQLGQANQALANAGSNISSTAEKKAEAKPREVQPRAAAKTGPRGAMQAFKKMDAATTPTGTGTKPNFATGGGGGGGAGKGRAVQRSQSDIKQMLLNWVLAQTREYENIEIKNFSTSWSDGLAFCALIHHFYPEAFDFSKLDGKNPRANFQLAFDTAEKLADIAPLIEVDDMMKMHKNPDWKCVFVYVQSFYRRFYRQTMAKSSEGSDEPTTPTTPDTPVSPAESTSSETDKHEQ